MVKHGFLSLLMFSCIGFFLVLNFPTLSYGKEYADKPNIVHDFIGAKILTEQEIPFDKILSTKKGSVLFCDSDAALYLFDGDKEELQMKENKSKRCNSTVLTEDGVKEDKGTGKLFGGLFSLGKEKDADTDSKED